MLTKCKVDTITINKQQCVTELEISIRGASVLLALFGRSVGLGDSVFQAPGYLLPSIGGGAGYTTGFEEEMNLQRIPRGHF